MDELNSTDIFVLNRIGNIHIWNMNPNVSSPNKIRRAIALANYIKNVEKTVLKAEIFKESLCFFIHTFILQANK